MVVQSAAGVVAQSPVAAPVPSTMLQEHAQGVVTSGLVAGKSINKELSAGTEIVNAVLVPVPVVETPEQESHVTVGFLQSKSDVGVATEVPNLV